MREPPHKLDYAPRASGARRQNHPVWMQKLDAILRMCFGVTFLSLGVINLIALLQWREHAWKFNLFMGRFATLAGYVALVRPLYRLARGRNWWTLQ